jgi:hypothetical protein
MVATKGKGGNKISKLDFLRHDLWPDNTSCKCIKELHISSCKFSAETAANHSKFPSAVVQKNLYNISVAQPELEPHHFIAGAVSK